MMAGSSCPVRRTSRFRGPDAADINRNQILNRRAAVATAAAAFLAALHFAINVMAS